MLINAKASSEMIGKSTTDEEPATIPCSCLTPRGWRKGGKEGNELSDIVASFDGRDDNNATAAKGNESSSNEVLEDKDDERDAQKPAETGAEADSPNDMSKTETQPSQDPNACTEDVKGNQVAHVKEENPDVGEVLQTERAEEKPVTSAAIVEDSPTDEIDEDGEEDDNDEERASLEIADDEAAATGTSLLKLAKNKPQKPRPKPQTPKRALFDDDLPDDESEASIEVLFRYMGCTQEAYGERYHNPTISASMTMETAASLETSTDENDLIDNIETIESEKDDGEGEDDDQSRNKETADDNVSVPLQSPSGNVLESDDDDDDTKKESAFDFDEKSPVESDKVEMSGSNAQIAEDPNVVTPIDAELNDSTSPKEKKEDKDGESPIEEQSNDTNNNDDQLEVKDDKLNSVDVPPVFKNLTVNTKPEDAIPSPVVSPSAAMDRMISRMSKSAMSPSVKKIALALLDAPKYPTTDCNTVTDSNNKENKDTTVLQNHDGKEVNHNRETEGNATEVQEIKDTSIASDPLSKVEEMDKLIKSTRAWLQQQKAERKVMDIATDKTLSPKTALPAMKKLDTSLPETKSPPSTKKTSSQPQPLSPRTLDSLLLSRKTNSSDGPKRSILEQLEEIRAKQRLGSPRSPLGSPRSP